MNYHLKEIAEIVEGEIFGDPEATCLHVVTDSRLIPSPGGALFFASTGPHFDGHDFMEDAAATGVRNFVVEKDIKKLPKGTSAVLVKSSLQALQRLARHHRSRYDLQVVGVTGSNGKTIVKEWLAAILGRYRELVKNPGSYNSQLGVPLSVLGIEQRHEVGVFEAGISRPQEMVKLEKIIRPTIGLFTNIGEAHDEGFDSRQQKIREKLFLFKNCQKIICCADHKNVSKLLLSEFGKLAMTWSTENVAADLHFDIDNNLCRFHWQGKDFEITLPVTQQHQVENLLHAITVALILGLDGHQLQEGVNQIQPVDMRLSLKEGINHSYIIDDTYNNDLTGLQVALETLSQQQLKSKKTIILSDIIQSHYTPQELYGKVDMLVRNSGVHRVIGVGPEISAAKDLFPQGSLFFESTEKLLRDLPVLADEMVLIKGARTFEFEKIVAAFVKRSHRTQLLINFPGLLHNLNSYKAILQPDTKLMVMVKALAYGGGSYEIANFLQYHQVDYLAVAYTDEGVELRQNGIEIPIMVMNAASSELAQLLKFDLEPEVYNLDLLRELCQASQPLKVHLKVESGMRRLGLENAEIKEVVQLLSDNPQIEVLSVFSHLAAAENPLHDDFTRQQERTFATCYEQVSSGLSKRPIRHLLNSGGISRWPAYQYDMVRLGIGLFGVDPAGHLPLTPASSLITKVSQVRRVKKGESIGYGRSGIMSQDGEIATLPIGYADGYSRVFGNGRAKVEIGGHLAPTVGHICMDMTMIDVTGLGVKPGDEVVIFGNKPSLQDLATWGDTIPYEILTNVGPRVKRVYSWI